MNQLRKLIDQAAMGKGTSAPKKLGPGVVWFVPSASELGAYYLVAEMIDTKKKNWSYMACECKGYRFSEKDEEQCQHVKSVLARR